MKSKFLFPYWTRYLGYVFVFIHLPIMLIWKSVDDPHGHLQDGRLFNSAHLFFMSTILVMVIGLFLVAFSKEKVEDEQIAQLRLDSLRWAIYLNYLILTICMVFTTGADYKDILRLNIWVPLAFFIIRFRWVIYLNNRSLKNEGNLI